MEKNQIRNIYKQKRNQINPEEIQKYSKIITDKIRSLDIYEDSNIILSYFDFGSEVVTRDFLNQAVCNGKQVFIPRVIGNEMKFYQYTSIDDLEISHYGILEPSIEQLEFQQYMTEHPDAKNQILMILPGLVFDLSGNRIGYGGGYYDRFLATHKDVMKLAVCFDFQIINDELPAEEFDQKIDYLVSELDLYTIHK